MGQTGGEGQGVRVDGRGRCEESLERSLIDRERERALMQGDIDIVQGRPIRMGCGSSKSRHSRAGVG